MKHTFHQAEIWIALVVLLSISIGFVSFIDGLDPELMPSITGLASSTVNITAQSSAEFCSFSLLQGWNMVSFFCLTNYPNQTTALAPISGQYISVFAYNPDDANNSWYSYNPNLPTWVVQDLTIMDRRQGYWINMLSTQNYTYNGSLVKQDIPLSAGWQLVGYPNTASYDVTTSFSSIAGEYTLVYIYNATTDTMQYYDPASPGTSTFNTTHPYYGYWVNATTSTTWTQP